jgi:hypothetical protein
MESHACSLRVVIYCLGKERAEMHGQHFTEITRENPLQLPLHKPFLLLFSIKRALFNKEVDLSTL